MRHIDDAERRRRIAVRHGLAPAYRAGDPVAATRAMTVLHATEPASVHLAVAARTEGVSVADVDTALYEERSLVKQLAMRRTLFVFPRDLLPAAWGSASARVATAELKRLAGDVERAGVAADGAAWLEGVAREVVDHLADGRALDARTLREEVPALETRTGQGTGAWSQLAPVASRVLTLLGARGDLVRGRNAGHWRISRPAWTSMVAWLGSPAEPAEEREGYAELVRRWLTTFGPGTETDVVWWLGATKSAVRRALGDVGAVEVSLDGGSTGWVLPDDADQTPDPGPWAALLPTLDPTTMGWKQRAFHLDPADVPYLFDSNGNGGTTAWWNGRVVGCWVQDPDGAVRVVPRGDVGDDARRALDAEAERLTAWLGGEVVGTVYASAMMKGARLP
ncbi:winged helix DNA-binding domain-containing protein [Nocardioides sp. CFH 31398]|uniref:winged helix DNA-binding domain-containing protein n=1 Tax=Nocardioides sp. CFH 31398 TaxID=2919579 RepID=UPI001F050CB0|nr:winged helix DNA-binding domain-containing protein [Nocardioides sp. CFH 31398]MCH1867245.1 winged helix DNA-binding domain-containing protein [Nocardioides sp. CFH 31398]